MNKQTTSRRAQKFKIPLADILTDDERDMFVQDVFSVIKNYPELSKEGFRYQSKNMLNDGESFMRSREMMYSETFVEEVDRAFMYITQHNIRSCGSYDLKHNVERFFTEPGGHRPYVSNGAAIVAAIMCGWVPTRPLFESPDCRFYRKLNS